ncbi:Glycosyltransferase [Quillaja saponaria]|uniref:Glycosyltransferase n=1 Tax=Quillaja saponaria TaxID=32244 RepID=A0AAD7Q5Q0_QUISA|nr:Glycosyltransferase [Quillaja saponaria]
MKNSATGAAADTAAATDNLKPCNSADITGSHVVGRRILKTILLFVGISVMWIVLQNYASPFGFMPVSYYFSSSYSKEFYDPKLENVLRNASMKDKTVILTTLNDAWAEPDSIFDIFLESFRIGNQTERLLKHLVVITLDQKAYARCLVLHPHCYYLKTKGDNFSSEAFFMSSDYLHMMWRRIQFLGYILELGYSFVFTDTDIVWLRDPFQHFYKNADFQIACDYFNGNSYDVKNMPNGGFNYVKSNNRTIRFYKFWFDSRKSYPKQHDQDVLNKIKNHSFFSEIKLRMRFLDTAYFGGFCQASRDFNKVCTMHANCCVGLENKVDDLKLLLLDWRKYVALPPNEKQNSHPSWSAPKSCRGSIGRAMNGKTGHNR